MNDPIMFVDQNLVNYFNIQPSAVKSRACTEVEEYKRYLYFKVYSKYKFTIPKEWDLNYFRYYLFHLGSIAVIYTKEFGWVCQPYQIISKNLYHNPHEIQVYNEFIKTPKAGIVGINCGIVKILDDYYGLDDIVTRYAIQLAEIDKAFHINITNTNTSIMYEAANAKEANEIKEAYGRASTGEPFVVVKKSVTDSVNSATTLLPDPCANYLADKLLEARATVVRQFLTEIGIANANTEKKERLISDEVNQNNEETKAICSIIYDNLKSCFEEINKISDLSLSVTLNEEVKNNEVHSLGNESVHRNI